VPAEAAPGLTQWSACEVCSCRYASLGAAFFCPACGHNSARTTFTGALATVRASMDLADRLPTLMDDGDTAADVARHLAEDGLVRLWSSFQRFAEASYAASPASARAPARRNAFQNLDECNRALERRHRQDYSDFLDQPENADLIRLVQARHVLAHRDGLVDAEYVARSGDARYQVGQGLVVKAAEVCRLAALVQKLAAGVAVAIP
jgi:hypothetical protein